MAHLCIRVFPERETMTRIALLTCMLWTGFVASAHETKSKDPVRVIFSRMDVFYFKVDHLLLGADLEICSSEGTTLHAEKILHRKVLVDFYFKNSGQYIIKIKKGSIIKEFNFIKKEQCPEKGRELESITVKQGS